MVGRNDEESTMLLHEYLRAQEQSFDDTAIHGPETEASAISDDSGTECETANDERPANTANTAQWRQWRELNMPRLHAMASVGNDDVDGSSDNGHGNEEVRGPQITYWLL